MSMQEIVKFELAKPSKNLKSLYEQCFVLVNMTSDGSLDKVVLEAMACGKPVIVASKSFEAIFEDYQSKLIYEYENHIDLGNKLLWLFSLGDKEKNKMCDDLQKTVLDNYNIDAFMDRLVKVFTLELEK